MADKTGIEWTDATWNPITGCSVVSAGCKNCYAMKLAGTRLQHHPSRAGLTHDTKNGPVWTGEVRFNEQWLVQPLRWKKPRMIFVCAHADLFHESVPDEWIDLIFAVMANAPQHKFQVLTKRAERMREYLNDSMRLEKIYIQWHAVSGSPREAQGWPLPNVWLGVSVEDQAAADERIPLLLDTPAAVRWISAEPLLGRVDLCETFGMWWNQTMDCFEASHSSGFNRNPRNLAETAIDWVVVGGESGQKARPMHQQWARDLRGQCAAAGVPFLFKQWGEWMPTVKNGDHIELRFDIGAPTGPDQPEFHDWPDGAGSARVGKKAAGRLLDGVQHDGYPEGGAA